MIYLNAHGTLRQISKYTFAISLSKLGSGLKERFETSFFRQVGHSLLLEMYKGEKVVTMVLHKVMMAYPLRRAVMIHS